MKEIDSIENKIITIRNTQVMTDRDIALLYGVETKVLNQAVKRNIERFPTDFMFQMSDIEFYHWKSQFVTSNSDKMGLRRPPYLFTEQGVAMLSAVLKSEQAIKASIQIMKAFVSMRKVLANNSQLFEEIYQLKQHMNVSDKRIEELFQKMDQYKIETKQGIFYKGQIFDAYVFVSKLIQKATESIIIIDNYIDLSLLELLAKKAPKVRVTLYTQNNTNKESLSQLDISKFNSQYPFLEIKYTTCCHDRFIILDHSELYHVGASLKDLGKKCFAFTILNDSEKLIPVLINNVEQN